MIQPARCLLLLFAAASAFAAQEPADPLWSHDYVAALKRSAEFGKAAFVYFSGSNWCGFCKRFDREIAADKVFQGMPTITAYPATRKH